MKFDAEKLNAVEHNDSPLLIAPDPTVTNNGEPVCLFHSTSPKIVELSKLQIQLIRPNGISKHV